MAPSIVAAIAPPSTNGQRVSESYLEVGIRARDQCAPGTAPPLRAERADARPSDGPSRKGAAVPGISHREWCADIRASQRGRPPGCASTAVIGEGLACLEADKVAEQEEIGIHKGTLRNHRCILGCKRRC